MDFMKIKKLLFWGLLLLIGNIKAADFSYKFRTISPDGGFYYDGIKDIEQDQTGFIWVMMDYGLYRFDGYHYKRYHSYFAEMQPTRKWVFRNMASDNSGGIFVNTNNGLYLYNPILDSFQRIYDGVQSVEIDGRNRVWIRTNNRWYMLNPGDASLIKPEYEGAFAGYHTDLFCVHNSDLYTFSLQRIYRFNYVNNKNKLCLNLPDKEGIIRFAQTYMGKLWIFTDKGLLCKIDLASFHIEKNIICFLIIRRLIFVHFVLIIMEKFGLERLRGFMSSLPMTKPGPIIPIPVSTSSVCRTIPSGGYMRTNTRIYGLVPIREH